MIHVITNNSSDVFLLLTQQNFYSYLIQYIIIHLLEHDIDDMIPKLEFKL